MSDGGIYKVKPSDQIEASGYVDKAMTSVRSDIDDMKTETDKLLGTWDQGTAQDAFRGRQAKWLESANDIHEILGRFKTSLGTSADISTTTENDNTTTITG